MYKVILCLIVLCISSGCAYSKYRNYYDGVLHKQNTYYINKEKEK